MDLPDFLIDQIKRGQVVLFLGAGVSVGSTNRMGDSPPMGFKLAESLSAEASIPFDSDVDDLATVAANAQRRLGDHKYWRFLQDRYQNCTPSEALKLLANYPWHRIYTLNIDDAFETAYNGADYSYQASVHLSPVFERPTDRTLIQLIHLNGSIDRLESGLIFTASEYSEQQGKIGSWYEEAARDFLSYTFLFVGTKLNEPLFQHHVDRLVRAKGQRTGTAFIVCPSFSANRRAQLEEGKNIVCLEGSASDLVDALHTAIGPRVTAAQLMRGRYPAIQKLIDRMGADEIARLAGDLESLDVVSPDQMRRLTPMARPGIRSFYFGSAPTWRDIIDGVPALLAQYELLNKAISSGSQVILLHGPAGSGKSTGLMSSAFRLASDNPDAIVFWFNGETNFPGRAVEKVAAVDGIKVVVFVDNVGMHVSDLAPLILRVKSRVTFVLAERTNQLPGRGSEFYIKPDASFSLAQISDADIDEILNKVEQFGPWDRLGRMPKTKRHSVLRVAAQKQLLVGLREVTEGTGYDQIAASEFNQLSKRYATSAYVLIALATMHRLTLSRETFDIAIKQLSSDESDARLEGLEEVAFDERGWLRIRHQILADFSVRKIVERSLALRAVDSIFFAQSRFGSPIRRFTNKAETRLFAALTNHDFLWSMFRAERSEVLDMFARWERAYGDDALFWLQYALFEQKCGPSHLDSAVNHIRIALRIYPDSYQVLNAYSNIHFALALAERSSPKALLLMEQASQVIEDQIATTTSAAYAAVALFRGRVSVLKKHFPGRVAGELKVAEERLREVFLQDPGNANVQSALNQLNLEAARG